APPAGPQTLHYDTVEGKYSITYDPAKINEAQVKNAIFLSPYTSVPKYWFGPQNAGWGPGKYVLAPALDLCPEEIPGYTKPCGFDQGHFLENAKVSLAEGDRQIGEVQAMQIPAELEPIRQAFLKELRDSQWQGQIEYRWYSDGDLERLRADKRSAFP